MDNLEDRMQMPFCVCTESYYGKRLMLGVRVCGGGTEEKVGVRAVI